MAFDYNRNYGSFIRSRYGYLDDDYFLDPDELNFGLNYEGNVAAIWVGSNPRQYAYCELTSDTSLTFSHSLGKLSQFSVVSDKISLTAPLVDCQYEIRAPLGTFTNLAAPYKMFDIKHPSKDNKRLRHACLEGPEIAVYIRGRLYNETTIILPDYWENLVDLTTINVQLTQIGDSQELAIESLDFPLIHIKSNNGSDINCYYFITATRKDVQTLEIEYDDNRN